MRDVLYQGNRLRQRPVTLFDVERVQTWAFCDAPPAPPQRYRATLLVTPVIDGNRAFIEWRASFDREADRRDGWREFYRNALAAWLGSLRRALGRNARSQEQA